MKRMDFNDPRYLIPGTNIFLLSKWSRENEPKNPPKYKVGDRVIVTIETDVVALEEDCDGTPLYELRNLGHGFGEGCMQMAQ